MLRFLSRRRNRHSPMGSDPHAAPAHHQQLKDKNILPCRIILLDGTDLSVDLSVRVFYCLLPLDWPGLDCRGGRMPMNE